MRNVVFVMLLLSTAVAGLVLGRGQVPHARTQHVHMKLAPVPASKVNIFSDADAVGKYVMARVEAAGDERTG